ncbi:MAG: hypothetical protein FWD15_01985 [Alphaproteobacteria bacterium]|nr:hypothetical protein [Alphaproteobacteria bacterium]
MTVLYHNDKNLKEIKSEIISLYEEAGKCCVQLRDELFYPRGGGQKGDRGKLIVGSQEFAIVDTVKDKYGHDSVLIVEPALPESLQDATATCVLDYDFRARQMKLHTCLHLHHCVLEQTAGKKIPYPETASIEDGFAFNKYKDSDFDPAIAEPANKKFLELIKTDAAVITYPEENAEREGFRWWECCGNKIPCGGLHVDKLNEIGDVKIDVSNKKGKISFKFSL